MGKAEMGDKVDTTDHKAVFQALWLPSSFVGLGYSFVNGEHDQVRTLPHD